MSNVLVFVEHAKGEPKKNSLAGISFGKQAAEKTGGELHLLVMGKDVGGVAEKLKSYDAKTIHVLDHDCYASYLAQSYSLAVVEAARAAGAVVIGGVSSSTTRDLLPRVSAKLDAAMASDVLEVISQNQFKREMWAGSVIATVELTTTTKVCTVRATEFEQPEATGSAEINNLDFTVDLASLKTTFVSLKEVKSERPDITTAARVVGAGRGIKGPEGYKLIEGFADQLGAGIGASRAVCDAGWAPNDLQIGQTGKIVAPDLYIAVGISGAIQHLAGMKSSKTIVAINKDPEAPIFQVADYGLVADLFKAVPELMESLK